MFNEASIEVGSMKWGCPVVQFIVQWIAALGDGSGARAGKLRKRSLWDWPKPQIRPRHYTLEGLNTLTIALGS